MATTLHAVTQIQLKAMSPGRSGKVREVFDLGDTLLMVATDRVSAFDVVLPTGVPDRGKILNQISAFWFQKLETPHHMISISDEDLASALGDAWDPAQLRGRSMLVKKCEPILLECVVRGYLAGSLYKEYLAAGGAEHEVTLHGIPLPAGLRLSDKLPEPIFTPATKAQEGHDENIDMNRAREIVGDVADHLRTLSLDLYRRASEVTEKAGIILADTKMEFGYDADGNIVLIDEVFTPDSSRFWPRDEWRPGENPPSHDKQFIRDYLETLDWDKNPPGPELPENIVMETRARYIDIYRAITGQEPVL
ncbi:MAG: phosphoribosylaminoimidazolesuccinocarboxamide synthase [Armatimonadetes bacterium]|nr:MAG: phosphoribosylaminoimidazolesuccinocarboxamide synthase [Armatimonadota bacterium]